MRAPAKLLVVALSLVVLVAPTLLMAAGVSLDRPLDGKLTTKTRPQLTLSAVGDETFQRGFAAWFEDHYGGREAAVRLDNSIGYWGFRETRTDSPVRVGKRGVLFFQEQLYFFNRYDHPDVGAMAAKLKRAQDLLLAQGKVLILLLVPSKVSVYPDEVPEAWRSPLGYPRPGDTQVYRPYVDALARAGVMFVDGRALLADLARRQPDAIYTRAGRHLTASAMCLILQRAYAIARPRLAPKTIPAVDCGYDMRDDVPLIEEEFDLFRLLNVWSPRPHSPAPVMHPAPETVPASARPDALVVGSSFGWKIVHEMERTHAARTLHYYYYDTTGLDAAAPDKPWKLAPKTPEWRELTLSKDLFLLDMPEEYLIKHNENFLQEIIDALDGPRAGAP